MAYLNHRAAFYVIVWFVFNAAMSNILKWTYVYGALTMADGSVRRYTYPLFISSLHMLFCWVMCGLYLQFIKGWPEKTLTIRQQIVSVWPLGVCFALSIASNNLSLVYIFPSLNQMLASLGPIITVGLAVMIFGTRYNWYTWASMVSISGGLMICASFDADFNAAGVTFAMLATALRGLKSIMQQRILTEKVDSILLLFYMAPCAGASMLLGSAWQEGAQPVAVLLESEPSGARACALLLALGSCNACFVNLANFLVTKHTSAVTLQVLGNVKSCLNIGVSVVVFGNQIQALQSVGVAVCMFGTWVYNKKGGVYDGARRDHVRPGATAEVSRSFDVVRATKTAATGHARRHNYSVTAPSFLTA